MESVGQGRVKVKYIGFFDAPMSFVTRDDGEKRGSSWRLGSFLVRSL